MRSFSSANLRHSQARAVVLGALVQQSQSFSKPGILARQGRRARVALQAQLQLLHLLLQRMRAFLQVSECE